LTEDDDDKTLLLRGAPRLGLALGIASAEGGPANYQIFLKSPPLTVLAGSAPVFMWPFVWYAVNSMLAKQLTNFPRDGQRTEVQYLIV